CVPQPFNLKLKSGAAKDLEFQALTTLKFTNRPKVSNRGPYLAALRSPSEQGRLDLLEPYNARSRPMTDGRSPRRFPLLFLRSLPADEGQPCADRAPRIAREALHAWRPPRSVS